MKGPSFRAFFSKHPNGCLTGALLRTWDWIFDRPAPVAYGATQQDVCDALEASLLAAVAAGEDELDRYLWDESFSVKTIRIDVRPQTAMRGASMVGKRTIPIEMTYLASRVPGAGFRIVVPRFEWRFIVEDLSVAPEMLRQALSTVLLGETAREVYEFRKEGEEFVHAFAPRAARDLKPSEEDEESFPTLRGVGDDLVEVALRRKLPVPVGECPELDEAAPLTDRDPPGSLLLLGPPGVGKSTWVSRLAHAKARAKRQKRDVSRLWSTTADRLLAGMSYLGMWQQRCLDLIEELSYEGDYLYLGRLTDILREQPDGDTIAGMLLEPIREGEVSIIVEATEQELSAATRRAPSFVSALQVVRLKEPSAALMHDWVLDYQRRRASRVELHPAAIGQLVHYLRAFRPDTAFPGKAFRFVDWLDQQAAARTPRPEQPRMIYPRDVSDALSRYTGLPLALISDDVPASADWMAAQLARGVVGQDAACAAAARVLARFKAGLNDPERPCGTLLFTGPTGVGKTELAKQLARTMFGDESRMIRLDMSEYMLPGSASRLLDADERTSSLARRVRQQPLSLVLLDEIEKAHPEVFDLLLSILGEGRLSDEEGRLVDFRMALIVMTSNLGAGGPRDVGFATAESDAVEGGLERAVRAFFRPEFFNRIDHVVGFRTLGLDDVERIVDLEVERAALRPGLARRGLRLRVTRRARRRLAELGFLPEQGARPLKRVFEARVIAPVAARMAADDGFRDRTVTVDAAPDGSLSIA
jgi:ATP-dependent Clp protease ATP-binding subunit ClpC